jgi:eukaryotic-like serine/threonine-protein kinase
VDGSSHLPSPVNVGDIVDKYRVEHVVGIGAMGVVVAARHTTLDQIVAIKFLVEHRFGSRDESIARFLGEARAAARIQSDHVCRVSDVGMLPTGVPYMIMEYLDGNDLEDEIINRGQLELVEAVDYVLQACDAIAAAHQLGIVHRDLKPANLFLARRPDGSRRVKVLDFGISKATTIERPRFTRETKSLGTPAYMPPEQIKDPTGVDHRADIWALGAILYEILTGQMAFVGENVQEVLDRVLGEDPCPIPALRRDVPPELIAIIGRALARDRDARWQTAATFARALAPFGSIGVLAGLASIQREVGSLSSISGVQTAALASPMHPAAMGSKHPMAPISQRPSGSSMPPYAPPGSMPPYAPPGSMPPYAPPGSMPPYAPPGSMPPYAPPGSMPPYAPPGSMPPYASAPMSQPPSQPYYASPYAPQVTAPSVEPMVSSLPREMQTLPDPSELNRRHFVVQDWTALQTRRRRARTAILVMVATLLSASALAVVAYRLGRPRLSESAPASDSLSGSLSAAAQPGPLAPPPLSIVSQPPASSAPAAPSAADVHPASSSVHSASSAVRPNRAGAPKPIRH